MDMSQETVQNARHYQCESQASTAVPEAQVNYQPINNMRANPGYGQRVEFANHPNVIKAVVADPVRAKHAQDIAQSRILAHEHASLSSGHRDHPNQHLPQTSSYAVVEPPDISINYRLLLISLADQYIAESRRLGHAIACEKTSINEIERYYKLVAAGLTCYKSLMKQQHSKVSPREEATVQLRYANLLFEETENKTEAEAVLQKGIVFCDRSRLLDLKYSMQHLLARVVFTTKPKVALKFLEKSVEEAAAPQHIPWVYAFRFLQVTLNLQLKTLSHTRIALQTLAMISDTAAKYKDVAIIVIAETVSAMSHLLMQETDSVSDAQRALASARAQQLHDQAQGLPQLNTLIHFIDVTCSIVSNDQEQASNKIQPLQHFLSDQTWHANSPNDSVIAIPLRSKYNMNLVQDTCGLFSMSNNQQICLNYSWLTKNDANCLVYLICALATANKSSTKSRRSETFLKEGLKLLETISKHDSKLYPRSTTESFATIKAHRSRQQAFKLSNLLVLSFLCADRTDWPASRAHLQEAKDVISILGSKTPSTSICCFKYLYAVNLHGSGDLTSALSVYQSSELKLPDAPLRPSTSLQEYFAILATLNILFITRPTDHPQHHLFEPLFDRLQGYFPRVSNPNTSNHCPISVNPHLTAIHALLTATLTLSNTSNSESRIVDTKHHLSRSLNLARVIVNNQLTLLTMSYMCSSFYAGTIADKSLNSADAVRKLATQQENGLWASVSDGVLSEMLELSGRQEQAENYRKEAETCVKNLPRRVKEHFQS